MNRKNRWWIGLVVLCCASAGLHANPTGISYDVLLDFEVTDGEFQQTEGHLGSVIFDGEFDPVSNDLDPSQFDPDDDGQPGPHQFQPGNLLWVTEHVSTNSDGTEHLSFWIFGDDDGDSATLPEPGGFGPLVINEIVEEAAVFLNLEELYWEGVDDGFVVISNLTVALTFEGGDSAEVPLDITPFVSVSEDGLGTMDDPYSLFIDFVPAELIAELGDPFIDRTPTDIHIDFDVDHVPEPASLMIGLAGLAMWRRRSR